MGGTGRPNESHGLRGANDRSALINIRDVFADTEPLATAQLDDFVNPGLLEVEFSDGLCEAETARMDVKWTTQDDYKFHYTDSDLDLRWGKHPHGGDYIHVPGLKHYHPPPNASSAPRDVEESCIKVTLEKLVARAVLTLWRVAYEENSPDALNSETNPP